MTGERIAGYRVVRRLATGSTSEVLLAKAVGPLGFERNVVIKLLLRHLQQELPAKVKGRQLQSIDLSDPEQPELGLPATPGQAAATREP